MFGCIVAGVAKTDTAQGAAKAAIDLAERNGAALHLVIAVAKSDAARSRRRGGVPVVADDLGRRAPARDPWRPR